MTETLLRLSEVETRIGFKRNWIYKRIKRGDFPAPIHIGSSSRWRETQINEWIAQHVESAA